MAKSNTKKPILNTPKSSTQVESTTSEKLSAIKTKALPNVADEEFALPFKNYKFILISFALIVLGFILMSGGDEDIYSFTRITLSVIVVMAGFIFMIYAIMKKQNS